MVTRGKGGSFYNRRQARPDWRVMPTPQHSRVQSRKTVGLKALVILANFCLKNRRGACERESVNNT